MCFRWCSVFQSVASCLQCVVSIPLPQVSAALEHAPMRPCWGQMWSTIVFAVNTPFHVAEAYGTFSARFAHCSSLRLSNAAISVCLCDQARRGRSGASLSDANAHWGSYALISPLMSTILPVQNFAQAHTLTCSLSPVTRAYCRRQGNPLSSRQP